jgi:hypothetical protein
MAPIASVRSARSRSARLAPVLAVEAAKEGQADRGVQVGEQADRAGISGRAPNSLPAVQWWLSYAEPEAIVRMTHTVLPWSRFDSWSPHRPLRQN